MLDEVAELLSQGKRERARDALREAVQEFCTDAFVSGETAHPFLSPKSEKLRRAIREVAGPILGDVERGRAVAVALESADRSIRSKSAGLEALDQLNFALTKLLPDFSLVLDAALRNARFKLGGAASNVESQTDDLPLGPEIELLIKVADTGIRAFKGRKLDRLMGVGLSNFDSAERLEPEIATILDLREDAIVFQCPICLEEMTSPLDRFGEDQRCGAGHPVQVPRPSLSRMAAYLKARREAASGIARCKVCNGVIQAGKSGPMRAGYCTPLCAAQGPDRFGEFVPKEGRLDGEDVHFSCKCGASMSASAADVGSTVACLACPLQLWIPAPADRIRSKGARPCGRCGKPVKASASKCMYCGNPIS